MGRKGQERKAEVMIPLTSADRADTALMVNLCSGRAWTAVRPLTAAEIIAYLEKRDPAAAMFVAVLELGPVWTPRSRIPAIISGAPCFARTRSGGLCQRVRTPGSRRCYYHGSQATGPKTEEGRAAIAASNRRRAERRREEAKVAVAATREGG
jgi:hypothetical protein